MSVQVPKQYQQQVQDAAHQLGIPADVVAAQIDTESSWNPRAVSPAGAQGIAQFEPGTWASYGHGSPFNPDDAFRAYVAYMGALLHQEGGDVRKALEAYNAGPGNLGAGAGYADGILSRAGAQGAKQGTPAKGTGSVTDQLSSAVGDLTGGLISWPGGLVDFFTTASDDLTSATSWFAAFGRVSTWLRIGAGVLAIPFLVIGLWCLIRATRATSTGVSA